MEDSISVNIKRAIENKWRNSKNLTFDYNYLEKWKILSEKTAHTLKHEDDDPMYVTISGLSA